MLTSAVGLAALVLALLATPASAATIIVNNDLDTTAADGFCALREAVFVANTNEPTGGRGLGNLGCAADNAGADTIVLTVGHIYTLTNQFAQEDNNIYGDLDIESEVTITTNGGLATIDGPALRSGDKDRVLHVEPASGGLTLSRIRVQNGHLTHQNTGVPGGGGGIYNQGSSLTVTDSEIVNNKIFTTAGTSTRGAGIYTDGAGSLEMTGSTVVGNVATSAANTDTVGGGITVYGVGSELTITNSTISGNTATGASWPGFAGGVFAGDGSALTPLTTLTSVTITGNSASGPGAITGGLQIASGTMTGVLTAGNSDSGGFAPDCSGGPASSGGGNLVGDAGNVQPCANLTGPGDLVGPDATPINPMLGVLANYGGLTRTHILNPGSPAINRGGSCPATDQRGFFRFNVLPCDSGSVELGASTTPPPPPPPPPAVITTVAETGQRAAALKKCKKKKTKKKRKKCKRKARLLPV